MCAPSSEFSSVFLQENIWLVDDKLLKTIMEGEVILKRVETIQGKELGAI
jgi:hypothetical protein